MNDKITKKYGTEEEEEEEKEEGEEDSKHFLKVKLSEKETKKEALRRAVSRMLKADWVVMADLWIDDVNGDGTLDDKEELGPEGDALWTRALNGQIWFEDIANARRVRDEVLKGIKEAPTSMDEVILAYDEELKKREEQEKLEEELRVANAITDLMEAKVENRGQLTYVVSVFGDDEEWEFRKMTAVGPFAGPNNDWREESAVKAVDRLLNKYKRLRNEWGDHEDWKEAVEDVDMNEFVKKVQKTLNAFNEERKATLEAWREADRTLRGAISKYNSNFPEEE